MQKDAKIYIAGHRGLVGSAIVNNLESKGFTNLVMRTHSELDLTKTGEVGRFFEKERPEYVFLAAAKVGGIVANNTYRAEFIYDNLMIQNNVVHQSFKQGVKKLMFLGSTCIYPKDCPQPMKEEYLLTDVLEYTNEPYAIAKIAGIKLCESYNLQHGTNFVSVMPTNLYGPNDNFDLEKSHVLPALIRKIHLGMALERNDWTLIRQDLDNLPIQGVDGANDENTIQEKLSEYGVSKNHEGDVQVEIWGSGRPRREFLWSEDMADACVFLMENVDFDAMVSKTDPEIRNTHINIGTGVDISIKDLAKLIGTEVGFKGGFVFNGDKPDGTPRKLTDVDKLNRLGWKNRIDLTEGVRRLYQWYLARPAN